MPPHQRFQRTLDQLYRWHQDNWIAPLQHAVTNRLTDGHTGSWRRLFDVVDRLPESIGTLSVGPAATAAAAAAAEAVQVLPGDNSPTDRVRLIDQLRSLGSWEKGPWRIAGVDIDAQWRSDLKWNRMAEAVDWRGATVIDLGSGNGYYVYRMIDRGAGVVIGLDPTASSICQALAVQRLAHPINAAMWLPIYDFDLPIDVAAGTRHRPGLFDIVVSMGVLYHHTAPIEHLRRIAALLRPGGTAIIETIDCTTGDALFPKSTYAGMNNVWTIPSIDTLTTWLRRCGLTKIEVVDRSVTSIEEQRSTAWSSDQSLADFLDPNDADRTIEGYPRPHRVIVRCQSAG